MLKHRKEGIKKVNEIFGTNITVDFSEVWKKEKNNFVKEGEKNEMGENTND